MNIEYEGNTDAAKTALRWYFIRSIAIWVCATAVVCTLIVRCS